MYPRLPLTIQGQFFRSLARTERKNTFFERLIPKRAKKLFQIHFGEILTRSTNSVANVINLFWMKFQNLDFFLY